jgi:hypothetical protein
MMRLDFLSSTSHSVSRYLSPHFTFSSTSEITGKFDRRKPSIAFNGDLPHEVVIEPPYIEE